jgi:hypothetical protein
MDLPKIIHFFCPPTDTRSLESIQEKSRRSTDVDVRTMAERVAGKPPRWEMKTVNGCLKDGVCQICQGTHPEHKADCCIRWLIGPIYNILSLCPECLTNNKVHYPDCSEFHHSFWTGDIPLMTKNQLETTIDYYNSKMKMLLGKKKRPGFVWGDSEQWSLEAMEATLSELQAEFEKR